MEPTNEIGIFPLSQEEEDHQLRVAIMMSLQDIAIDDKQSQHNVNNEESQSQRRNYVTKYTRANTSAETHGQSSSHFNYESSQMLLRRSMSMENDSPPRSTTLTDCCEVKNALLVKNREYIKCLVTSWGGRASPLHVAVKKGHGYCLEELLKAFPDLINSTNTNGETPLYLASLHAKPRAVQQLLQNQANPNIGRCSLETPLLAAVDNDHREVTLYLLKGGADVNKPLNRGWTALHEAVYRGHSEVLGILLRHGGNPNIRDGFGISPVFTSAACGRNQCLKILLQSGGDPNLCAKSKSASPLYEACKEGHIECVSTLLCHGANPHLVNCDGLYPIHVASYKGYIDIVEALLPITDREMAQTCGMSPVHSAAKGDHVDIMELLINHGYDVNIKLRRDKITYRDRRQTALFFAVYNDSEEAAEILLEAGANTELDYVKPLLVAVSHSQYDMTNLLLSYGADINASFNEDGATFPAAIAFAIKDFRMLKQVLTSGCDVAQCLKCGIGAKDHSQVADNIRRKYFCHFLIEDNYQWSGCTILYLLNFVGNIKLCRKILNNVQSTEEWPFIKQLIEHPRTLQHLCRLKIRETFGTKLVRNKKVFYKISMPKPIIEYLLFNDM